MARGSLLASALFVAVLPLSAYAQTASQVTPPTFRPPSAQGGVVIGTPGQAPLQAPAEAAGLLVSIAGVRAKGIFPEVAADAERIIRRAKGRRFSVTQLYEIASAIEQLHVNAGFVLARVIVPPQEIEEGGTFVIEVIDGFIESIDGKAIPERVREAVLSRVNGLVNVRHITLAEIERRVLIAGDVPGVQLASALARGEKLGGTKLILQAVYRPLQGTLVSENRLNPSLGGWQHTASMWVNSPLGLGEQAYGVLAGSGDVLNEDSRLKMYAAGLVIPVGRDGLSFNPEYTLTRSTPLPAAGVPATEDRFERFAARVSYPFIRTRGMTLTGQTAYEHVSQQSEAIAFNALLSLDRYDLVRNSLQASLANGSGGSVVVSMQISNGMTGRSQADARAEAIPMSRQNAQSEFSKLSGEVMFGQALPNDVRLHVTARGQASNSGALLRGEQFSLESSDILTGWTSGTFLVDQGYTVRAELLRRFELASGGWLKAITPYVFAAAGHGQLLSPTIVERSAVSAHSVGLGARSLVQLPGNHFGGFTGLELSRRFTDDPDKPEGWRGVVSLGVRF